jgi:hypothetical protein
MVMTLLGGRLRGGLRRLVPGVLAVCAIAGCSSDAPAGDDKRIAAEWAAEFSRAKAGAVTDFEKVVFADSKITTEEYDEAIQRYVTCMNGALPPEFAGGFEAVKDEFGVYGYNGPQTTEDQNAAYDTAFNEADDRCGLGTKRLIEPLYSEMIMNPKRQTPEEQVLGCLKRHDLVEDSYTLENYNADFPASGDAAAPNDFDPSKATDLDVESDAVQKCTITPWQ